MADRSNELKENRPERRDVLLWIPVLAGPIAWALTEQLSYMLTPTACWTGSHLLLYLVPLCMVVIVLACAALAHGRWKRQPEGSTAAGDPRESRARFMAMAGFWLCVSFAVVILAEAVPNLILRVCD
jgi:uncharacterized membrane protein YidH (DUF202 family)